MNNIKVNINVQAKVVLTDYGKQILTDYYDKLGAIYYLDKKEFVFPLWQIASIFGDCLYMGNNQMPFKDNEIELIETEDCLIKRVKI